MFFHEVAQGTDDWFRLRLGKVTGSRFKDVLAIGARGTYLKAREDYKKEIVAERLAGPSARKDVYVTPEMLWGQMNEPLARTTYVLQSGNQVTQEGFCQHDKLMVGVSTDGLINDEGNLEIKCLTSRNHLYNIIKNAHYAEEEQDKLPPDYKAQVQGQLWITGRQWCDFVGYDSRMPSGLELFYIRVERDEDYINYLEEETIKFLEEVDKDIALFMKYLPVAERTCHNCGLVFVDKLNLCHGCNSNNVVINKIIAHAEEKL